MTMKGIDVSKYQGVIDWQAVKAAGIEFAMLRCGTGYGGGTKDPKFEANYKGAKDAGLHVGAYFYTYAKNADEAKAEAKKVIGWLKGKTLDFPVAYDVEDETLKSLGKKVISGNIRAFCEAIEGAGYYVSVYSGKWWLENLVDAQVKKRYDVWLAHWTNETDYSGEYGMWQCSDSGTVEGITGHVDIDVAYKDYPALIAGMKKETAKPAPAKTPAKKPAKAEPKYNEYTVKKGDTLTAIAEKYGTTWRTLAVVNNIADPDVITVGQKIKVPAKADAKPAEKSEPKAGEAIELRNAPLYATAYADAPTSRRVTGTFYFYDGQKINGKYRVTPKKDFVGKNPISYYVTGWVKL